MGVEVQGGLAYLPQAYIFILMEYEQKGKHDTMVVHCYSMEIKIKVRNLRKQKMRKLLFNISGQTNKNFPLHILKKNMWNVTRYHHMKRTRMATGLQVSFLLDIKVIHGKSIKF